MIYILIAFVTFVYVAHHFMMIANIDAIDKRNNQSRYDNVTHYTGAIYNRHGRTIERMTSQHVI